MIKITVSNSYFNSLKEEFIIPTNMADPYEMNAAIEECCAEYLEMHHDLIMALTPDLDYETLEEACYYIVEEVPNEQA